MTCPYIINIYTCTCMPFCFDRILLKTKRIKISKNVFATVFVHVHCMCASAFKVFTWESYSLYSCSLIDLYDKFLARGSFSINTM